MKYGCKKLSQVKLFSDNYEDVIKIMGVPRDGITEREYSEYFDFEEGEMFVYFGMGCRVSQDSAGKLSG